MDGEDVVTGAGALIGGDVRLYVWMLMCVSMSKWGKGNGAEEGRQGKIMKPEMQGIAPRA